MHTEHIFFELASEQRLSILFKLTEHDSKLAELSKDLNVTMQEVHRNLSRLMDAGLIEKDSAGTFSLTTFSPGIDSKATLTLALVTVSARVSCIPTLNEIVALQN